jgi:hypothetical protein
VSRSGYTDEVEDNWAHIRWRGAVKAGLCSERGQRFLRELRASLKALPEKKLCGEAFAKDGQVCAIGSVALHRKLKAGMTRSAALAEIEKEFPQEDYWDAPGGASQAFDISEAAAREIMYENDGSEYDDYTPEERYKLVLAWVNRQIIKKPRSRGR